LFYSIIAETGQEIKGQSFTFVNRGKVVSNQLSVTSFQLSAFG